MTESRCRAARCHRRLRDAESVARGYGPVCWRRINPPAERRRATPTHLPVGAASDPECPGQFALFEIVIVRVPS